MEITSKNLGRQLVKAQSNQRAPITVDVDVADKLTKPLLSVFDMICKKKNRVVYDDEESYILHKPSNTKIPLRQENRLFYLDLWVRVPKKLSDHPFVRQVA